MRVGVTATRNQINVKQFAEVEAFLISMKEKHPGKIYLHHGDCVGGDETVARLADGIGYLIHCHPPIKNDLRAFYRCDFVEEPKSYFARNRDIVNACDILLVVPKDNERQTSGGTWYTHDYAVKKGKPIHIIYPGII